MSNDTVHTDRRVSRSLSHGRAYSSSLLAASAGCYGDVPVLTKVSPAYQRCSTFDSLLCNYLPWFTENVFIIEISRLGFSPNLLVLVCLTVQLIYWNVKCSQKSHMIHLG